MAWIRTHTLDVLTQELVELRKERGGLLQALTDARDRGDMIVNALLEAKGAAPIPPSPSPPPQEIDLFAEDPTLAEEMRRLITEQGLGAAFDGR